MICHELLTQKQVVNFVRTSVIGLKGMLISSIINVQTIHTWF